jgi:RNA polymerase sigma-70 factor (ECF subfamily)
MSPPGSEKISKTPSSTAEKLAGRAKEGDKKAFDCLQALYKDRIYNYVARMVHDPIEAEDIVQEAFVKAYRNLPGFKGNSTFQTWLYRIASNLTIDAVRRRRRRENTCSLDAPLDTEDGEMGREQEDTHDPGPVRSLETAEIQRAVHACIKRLSLKLCTVVIMYDLQGMSYEEIAARLGCPLGTVKSRLYNARVELAKLFVEAGLVDESASSRYVASLNRKDPSVTHIGHESVRRRQEGTEMSEFSDRLKKIKDELILRAIKDGYAVADLQGDETVEEYLHRRAEELIESLRHPEGDGTTELYELAKGLNLDTHELDSYLRGVMLEKKEARIKEANFAFEVGPFVEQMAELAATNNYESEGNVAQYLGEMVLDWSEEHWEAMQECAGDYTVPEAAVLMVGLDHLERTYGETPQVKLTGEDLEVYCAFLDSEQAPVLKEALDAKFGIPASEEEYGLPDESEVDFDLDAFLAILVEPAGDYGFTEAPFVWEALGCMALEIDPESDAIERFAAAANLLEFPRQALLMAGFLYLRKTMDGEPGIELPERERDFYNNFLGKRSAIALEDRLKALPIPVAPAPPNPVPPPPPTREVPITTPVPITPGMSPVPLTGTPPPDKDAAAALAERLAAGTPPATTGTVSADDPSMLTSLTPGVFPSGIRGSWKQPVYTYLRETHPFFDAASPQETAEEWAPRIYAKGASCSVIAYILGGIGMTPDAVEMKLKNLRERQSLVIEVTEEAKARCAYLDKLVPERPKPDKGHKKGEGKPSKYPIGPVVFVVRGTGWSRIGWDKPATGTVLDKNPEFVPILGETRSDYAVRLFKQGYEARVIAYLLGLKENAPVTTQLAVRRRNDSTVEHTIEQRRACHYLFDILDKIESGELKEAPPGSPNAAPLEPEIDPIDQAKEELEERLRSNIYLEANAAFWRLAAGWGVYHLPSRLTVMEVLSRIKGVVKPEDLESIIGGLCGGVSSNIPVELLLPIIEELPSIGPGPEGDELDSREIIDIWRWPIGEMPILRAGLPEASAMERWTLLDYGEHLKREGAQDEEIFKIICGGSPLNEGQVAAKLALSMPDLTPPPPPPITPPIETPPPPITPPITPPVPPTQDPITPPVGGRTTTKMNQMLVKLIGDAEAVSVVDALTSISNGLPAGMKITPGILADIISQCEAADGPVDLKGG